MEPRIPGNLTPAARACIDALVAEGLARHVSLGGAVGLSFYLPYRTTHDLDAWWVDPIRKSDRTRVVSTIERALGYFGTTRTQSWGDVTSIDLVVSGRTVFSFQIASRSALVAGTVPSPWPGGPFLDSLDDLVASKMTALVERGAPRDFRDIHALVEAGLLSVERCWHLWRTRQELAGSNAETARAHVAIRTHLARIARARPLQAITDPEHRMAAENLRSWFEKDFLG